MRQCLCTAPLLDGNTCRSAQVVSFRGSNAATIFSLEGLQSLGETALDSGDVPSPEVESFSRVNHKVFLVQHLKSLTFDDPRMYNIELVHQACLEKI